MPSSKFCASPTTGAACAHAITTTAQTKANAHSKRFIFDTVANKYIEVNELSTNSIML